MYTFLIFLSGFPLLLPFHLSTPHQVCLIIIIDHQCSLLVGLASQTCHHIISSLIYRFLLKSLKQPLIAPGAGRKSFPRFQTNFSMLFRHVTPFHPTIFEGILLNTTFFSRVFWSFDPKSVVIMFSFLLIKSLFLLQKIKIQILSTYKGIFGSSLSFSAAPISSLFTHNCIYSHEEN